MEAVVLLALSVRITPVGPFTSVPVVTRSVRFAQQVPVLRVSKIVPEFVKPLSDVNVVLVPNSECTSMDTSVGVINHSDTNIRNFLLSYKRRRDQSGSIA